MEFIYDPRHTPKSLPRVNGVTLPNTHNLVLNYGKDVIQITISKFFDNNLGAFLRLPWMNRLMDAGSDG